MLDDAPPRSIDGPVQPARLYPKLLGAAWRALHPAVQRVHTAPGEVHGTGTFQVSRAPGRLMGRILDVARVPPSSNAAPVQVVIRQRGHRERWQRTFGGLPLVTRQSEAPGGLLSERAGILEFRFRLVVKDGALLFRQEGFAVRLGALRLPLPDWLSLKVAGREGPASASGGASAPGGACDRTTVDIRVTAPTGDLLFAYRGTVRWDSGDRTR